VSKSEIEYLMKRLVAELKLFTDAEKIAQQRITAQELRLRLMIERTLWIGVAFSIVIAVTLAVLFNRSTIVRLNRLMENTSRLAHEKPLHSRLTGTDEIAQLDKVFHDMAGALREASRNKKEFMEMVSHDLRTPLTSAQMYLHALLEGIYGNLSSPGQDGALRTESDLNRSINLINDLLDMERLEAGKLNMTFRRTSVPSIVQCSIDSVTPLAEQKGIPVASKVEDDLCVSGDGDRLIQVVINLLSNAIKFSPPKSVVSVLAEQLGTEIELRVTDQGEGIAPEDIGSIFDRYRQGESSNGGRSVGSGLGLSIAKAIIEQHGGTIGVESKNGKGSSFWFRIPVSEKMSATLQRRTSPDP